VLQEEQGRHPDAEQIERFSLGILSEDAIRVFEQHVLICPACQDRVAEMDACLQGLESEAKELRVEEARHRGKTGSSNSSN